MSDWFSNFDSFTQTAKEAVSKASARLEEIADGVRADIVRGAQTVEDSLFREEVELRKEKEEARAEEIQGLPWETSLTGDDKKALTENLRGRIMDLSLDEENFTIKPLHEAHFEDKFKLQSHTGIAQRMMAIDTNLARRHSKLIPNFPEHDFWTCYFYRVEMLRLEVDFEPLDTMVLATATTNDDTLKEETPDLPESSIELRMVNKQNALLEPEQNIPSSPNHHDDEINLELDNLEGLNDELEGDDDHMNSKQEGDDELEAQIEAELSGL